MKDAKRGREWDSEGNIRFRERRKGPKEGKARERKEKIKG